jgi:hypothetical protein
VESKHGGEIALRSSLQGAEFTVYLPINGGEPAQDQAAGVGAAGVPEKTAQSVPAK